MIKNKMLKILGGVIVTCLLFFGSAFGTLKIAEVKKFNNLVSCANQKFNTGNYDEAITLYNEALQIKSDNDIKQNIAIAQNYKQYQNVYNEGLKLITDKKYSEAIQKLSAINQVAGQIYTNAQGKIDECKKNVISEDVNATNTAISNKDYDSANKYIEDILKLDANNNDAKQLKTTIAQSQQKDREEAEQQNKKSVVVNSQENNSSPKVSKSNEQSQNKPSGLDEINSKLRILEYYITGLDKGSQKYRDALDYKGSLLKQKLDILKSQ